LKKASFDLPKTDVMLLYGQYNSYANNDNNITISQTIPFASLGSQRAASVAVIRSYELKKAVGENALIYRVKRVFYQLVFAEARKTMLFQQDSIFEGFLKSASSRYTAGETNLLEKTTAETQRNEVKNEFEKNATDLLILKQQLKTLINATILPEIPRTELLAIDFGGKPDTATVLLNPSMAMLRQDVEIARRLKNLEVAKFVPDLRVGFFNQTLVDVEDTESGKVATSSDRFTGFQIGVAIPLWFGPYQAKIKAAELARKSAQNVYEDQNQDLHREIEQAFEAYQRNKRSLSYYHKSALPNADLILNQSQISYKEGEIEYSEYLLGVKNAMAIKEGYLKTLNDYNQSVIYIEFLAGNK